MATKQMLTNLGLSSLEKLDSPLQWIDWNQRIKDALSIGGYSKIFRCPDKPTQRSTEDDDKFESRLEKWEEAQAQACSLNTILLQSKCKGPSPRHQHGY